MSFFFVLVFAMIGSFPALSAMQLYLQGEGQSRSSSFSHVSRFLFLATVDQIIVVLVDHGQDPDPDQSPESQDQISPPLHLLRPPSFLFSLHR